MVTFSSLIWCGRGGSRLLRRSSAFESHDPADAGELPRQTDAGEIPATLRAAFLVQPTVADILDRAHARVTTVVRRFALVAAALAMAIEAGVLPWTKNDTDAGIIACMQRWLDQRGDRDEAGELRREIGQRRLAFAAIADDRLIRLAMVGSRLVAASATDQEKLEAVEYFNSPGENFDGYIKSERVLLTSDAWKRLWSGLDNKKVTEHLLRQQLLLADRDGKVPSAEKVLPASKLSASSPSPTNSAELGGSSGTQHPHPSTVLNAGAVPGTAPPAPIALN